MNLEPHAASALALSEDTADIDAVRKLWGAVLLKVRQDLRIIRRYDLQEQITSHQRDRLARISVYPPEVFLTSSYFEEICNFLEFDADKVREALQ